MSTPEDKRKSVRVPVQLDIQIQKQPQQKVSGTTLNCSIDGMFIKTGETFANNDLLDLSFVLPGAKEPMVVRSRVVWCHDLEGAGPRILGLGVRFENLSSAQSETLRKFINEILNS